MAKSYRHHDIYMFLTSALNIDCNVSNELFATMVTGG